MTKLQQEILEKVRKRVVGFDSLSNGERVLQVNAYLADVVHVHEELGNNHGKWVDDFLREAGGLGPGFAWCAALQNWICEMLGIPNPDKADAAVVGWKNWAKANNRLKTDPKRGYLCLYLHADMTGHIGIVKGADEDMVFSIEGNTSAGTAGSQRDGDGVFRRTRNKSTWKFYIDLD